MITNILPNFQFINNNKNFTTYKNKNNLKLINNISNSFKKKINLNSKKIIYYIYTILHHKYYINKYSNNLNKNFPQIPILKNIYKFIKINKKLIKLHLNYKKQLN